MRAQVAAVLALLGVAGCVYAQGGAPEAMPAVKVLSPGEAQSKARADAQKDRETPIYDEQADAKAQIDAALARAKRENKRVLVQWGGNWCPWCIRLEKLYRTDKDIKRALQYEYETVFVDAGRPKAKNVDFAMQYGADLKKHGFPFLTILDADGKPLVNQESGSLEVKDDKGESSGIAAGHDPKVVLKLLTDHQAPALDSASVLQAATKRAKEEHKLVFLHFGAPWCGWCHRLEDWMQRPETAAVLGKYFVDCKIDVDRMTGGKDVQKRYVSDAKTGIPVFYFLSGEGTVVAGSIGKNGNVGYPGGDEEAPHFRAMLEAAKVSDADLATLMSSVRLDKK